MSSAFSIFKNGLIKGSIIICVGGFITKLIGAIYRIPLTNIIGAEGIGIYQMVFPLYSILLTLSSTGVPNGIAKLIASGENPDKVLKKSLKIFVSIGFLGSLFLGGFSYYIAKLQGNANATWAYIAISPSVVAVSVICAYRGYYQGFANMKPTAVSQIFEQVIKLAFGLTLAFIFRKNLVLSATFAVFAVSVSEIFVSGFFIVSYNKKIKRENLTIKKDVSYKTILKTVFPVMLSTLVLPLTRTIESFLIINILKKYLINSTSLYGLYSGVVESIIGVPVALLYGIAISSVPIIAKSKKEGNNHVKRVKQSILITAGLSVLSGACVLFLSKPIVNILYPNLTIIDKHITIEMLKIASLSVVFLPLMQTLSSILIAINKVYIPCISSSIASVIKIILSVILLNMPAINIFAVVITDILCYVVACFINLVYIIR